MGSNISDGKHPAGDFVFVTEAKAAELKSSEVREGDLVFPHRGAIGRVALIPPNTRMILSSSLMKLTPNQEKCCSDFLLYFFRSNRGVHELLKNASTVGTPGIGQPLSSLKRIPLEVPPLGEQKAIAHILGTLDDKIKLNRKTNETLEAMAKALFKSWFVDFDPVRAKVEGRPTGLPDEISDLFPDSFEDSELGEVPSGWEVAELGDCELDVESGRRPKGGIDKNLASGIPSIGAESIAPVGQFDFSKTKWVDNDFADSSSKGWIQNFDVALYKDGGKPGEFRPRTALYGDGFPFDKAMVNEHVFLLRSILLGQPYLYYLFNFDLVLAQIIHKGSSKGAQPGLNQEEVRSSSFIKPDKRLLDIFNQTVETSIKKQLLIGKQCQVLSQMRDALLPKLISGEIRIPDAERVLEEVGI
jgi:type I restriction enzyme S subunit